MEEPGLVNDEIAEGAIADGMGGIWMCVDRKEDMTDGPSVVTGPCTGRGS